MHEELFLPVLRCKGTEGTIQEEALFVGFLLNLLKSFLSSPPPFQDPFNILQLSPAKVNTPSMSMRQQIFLVLVHFAHQTLLSIHGDAKNPFSLKTS